MTATQCLIKFDLALTRTALDVLMPGDMTIINGLAGLLSEILSWFGLCGRTESDPNNFMELIFSIVLGWKCFPKSGHMGEGYDLKCQPGQGVTCVGGYQRKNNKMYCPTSYGCQSCSGNDMSYGGWFAQCTGCPPLNRTQGGMCRPCPAGTWNYRWDTKGFKYGYGEWNGVYDTTYYSCISCSPGGLT
jgi:hypothetical protein